MSEKVYTITLADGTVIEDLKLNGDNFISPKLINSNIFNSNLGSVTISDGMNIKTHKDMVLTQNTTYDGKSSWFILAPKSAQDKEKEALTADITNLKLALVEIYEQKLGGM